MTISISKYNRFTIICLLLAFLVIDISCKKKMTTPDDVEPNPQKTTLIYPNLNEACLSGKIISATKSEISFSWSAASYTDSYELSIKNLLSGEILKKSTTALTLDVELDRNTPYAWSVVSKKGVNATESDSWKFYNAGAGTTYYAPFPADQLIPIANQVLTVTNGKVNLDWEGADVDNDIVGYDVYLGTTATPPLIKANIVPSNLVDVAVNNATTYYWMVLTKDAKGNISNSGISKFKTN